MAPLNQAFPSLAVPLSTSRILGLYFASAWCPDCTPITPILKSVYNAQPNQQEINRKKLLEVVYVSSDSSADQMKESYDSSHGSWSFVPFDETDERSSLKIKYGACAAKEAPGLNLLGPGRRKFGIPTLILVDCETENILTTNGVNDIMEFGVESLGRWEKLLS